MCDKCFESVFGMNTLATMGAKSVYLHRYNTELAEIKRLATELVNNSITVTGDEAFNVDNLNQAFDNLVNALGIKTFEQKRREELTNEWANVPERGVLCEVWDDADKPVLTIVKAYLPEKDMYQDSSDWLWQNVRRLTKKEIESYLLNAQY